MADDQSFAELSARVARLERTVAFLLDQVKADDQDNPYDRFSDVVALKRQGKIIEAIKLYRTQTGVGLAEAKQFVDGISG